MSQLDTIGTGKGVAALFNANAKRFTPRVVQAFQEALPDALVAVSQDLAQARRHATRIVEAKPDVVFAGGGDGSIVSTLNALREAGAGRLPPFGVFKLGTGNAWARVTGAGSYFDTVRALPSAPRPLPTRPFDLVEVDGTICHFAGVGWDARLINDYMRNLDKRSAALVGSSVATRLHKGLGGYLYTLFRITVPEERDLLHRFGQARVVLENLDAGAFTLDADAKPVAIPNSDGTTGAKILYDGPVSVGAAASVPEWGYGFRAFPFAQALPGRINVRVYDRPVMEATLNMLNLWKGRFPEKGMHDFYSTRVRMRFSRPMPFQIAGDGLGNREVIEFRAAPQRVQLVDWSVACPLVN